MHKIPFFGLRRQYQNLKDEILDAVNGVYSKGQVLDGDQVNRFELQMAGRCHRDYAVAVNSCTQGLILSQIALNLSEETVVIPTVSFAATLNSVLMAGNTPRYCDVDDYGILNLESIPFSFAKENIKALMYVNLFGNVVDYDKLRVITEFFNNSELKIIEDAAQSFGAYYKDIPSGKLGTVSVLSFDPTKNLPNYGSGGMILTDDHEVYRVLKSLRDNGKEHGHIISGTNSKMSEADCAQMLVKLKYFDEWQRRRTEIAEFYIDNLKNYVRVTELNPDVTHAWHKFPIWLDGHPIDDTYDTFPSRSSFQDQLDSLGIETKIHYPTILPELDCNPYSTFLVSQGQYPNAERHSRTEVSLPIYPELTDLEVEFITESVVDCISSENTR